VGDEVDERSADDFFDGFPDGLALYEAVERAVSDIGTTTITVTKSQIAFRRRKGFAYVWRPGQYVTSDAPAVLSIALPHEVDSIRFTSVVHPSTGVWMHHIELYETAQVDDELRRWLTEAYANAR
jgi:hypothetical protein